LLLPIKFQSEFTLKFRPVVRARLFCLSCACLRAVTANDRNDHRNSIFFLALRSLFLATRDRFEALRWRRSRRSLATVCSLICVVATSIQQSLCHWFKKNSSGRLNISISLISFAHFLNEFDAHAQARTPISHRTVMSGTRVPEKPEESDD
jgi:hypothetical protein